MPKSFARSSLIALAAGLVAMAPGQALAQDAAPPADGAAAQPQGASRKSSSPRKARAERADRADRDFRVHRFLAQGARGDQRGVALGARAQRHLDGGTPFSGSSAVLAAYIRGIGANDFAFNIDPGVGIYLDGVYLARSVGANQDLPDVDRVEVLKGPQGTLFGRNTIGGAISIVTHDPGDNSRARRCHDRQLQPGQARGTVDMPLADKLYSSVTFAITNRDGFCSAFPIPARGQFRHLSEFQPGRLCHVEPRRGRQHRLLRGKLKWDNGGAITATLTGDYAAGQPRRSPTRCSPRSTCPAFAGTYNCQARRFGLGQHRLPVFRPLQLASAPPRSRSRRATRRRCAGRGDAIWPPPSPLASVNVDGDPTTTGCPMIPLRHRRSRYVLCHRAELQQADHLGPAPPCRRK
jgi:hypothetical protein